MRESRYKFFASLKTVSAYFGALTSLLDKSYPKEHVLTYTANTDTYTIGRGADENVISGFINFYTTGPMTQLMRFIVYNLNTTPLIETSVIDNSIVNDASDAFVFTVAIDSVSSSNVSLSLEMDNTKLLVSETATFSTTADDYLQVEVQGPPNNRFNIFTQGINPLAVSSTLIDSTPTGLVNLGYTSSFEVLDGSGVNWYFEFNAYEYVNAYEFIIPEANITRIIRDFGGANTETSFFDASDGASGSEWFQYYTATAILSLNLSNLLLADNTDAIITYNIKY